MGFFAEYISQLTHVLLATTVNVEALVAEINSRCPDVDTALFLEESVTLSLVKPQHRQRVGRGKFSQKTHLPEVTLQGLTKNDTGDSPGVAGGDTSCVTCQAVGENTDAQGFHQIRGTDFRTQPTCQQNGTHSPEYLSANADKNVR